MNADLCALISTRAIITFTYDGGGERRAEPHSYGVSSAGNDVLRAYQLEGASVSGKPRGWKLFEVAKIGKLTDTGTQFAGARDDFDPADKQMRSIYCHA